MTLAIDSRPEQFTSLQGFIALPNEVVAKVIFSYLSGREMLYVTFCCRSLRTRMIDWIHEQAQVERAYFDLPPHMPLCLFTSDFVQLLLGLPIPQRVAIGLKLSKSPILFYHKQYNNLIPMLDEKIYRTGLEELTQLVKNEKKFGHAFALAQLIGPPMLRSKVLKNLAKRTDFSFDQVVQLALVIPEESDRAKVVSKWNKRLDSSYSAAFKVARSISSPFWHAHALEPWCEREDVSYLTLLAEIQMISEEAFCSKDKAHRSKLLSYLTKRKDLPFADAIKIARDIPHDHYRSKALKYVAMMQNLPFAQSREIMRTIPSEYDRSEVIWSWSQRLDVSYVAALEEAQRLSEPFCFKIALERWCGRADVPYSIALALVKRMIFPENAIRFFISRLDVPLSQAEEMALSISPLGERAYALEALAKRPDMPFDQALKAARDNPDFYCGSRALSWVVQRQDAPLDQAFEIAKEIYTETERKKVIQNLTQLKARMAAKNLSH